MANVAQKRRRGRKQTAVLLLASMLIVAGTVGIGCGGGSSSSATVPAPSALSITLQSPLPSTLQRNTTVQLTAIVANDSTNAGVDWSVTCGSAGECGSFNPTHTASGAPSTYTAPATVPSGKVVTIMADATADKATSASASITITGNISVIAVDVELPLDDTVQAILPFVDGVTIFVNWTGKTAANGTDATTCVSAPCTQTSDFSAYDAAIAAYTQATCGASMRGTGSPCVVNLTFPPVSALSSYNINTPAWVFSQPWADTVGSAVQDAAFCSDYPQNPNANPLAPTAGIANINTTNCGSAGTTQCSAATVATGVPAIWEKPYVTAVNNWHKAIIQHYATATYPAYLRLGVSIVDEAAVTCSTINDVAGTGLESLTSPATADGLKAAWTGAAVNQIAYNASQRAALNPPPSWVLMNTVNMGQRLEKVNGDGGDDPSWAIVEANAILANQPYALGTQGLMNGEFGSDLNNAANSACTGIDCCSDNWCNVHTLVQGKVPAIELQTCNLSDPGGGTSHCLDCILAGTCTDDSETLSQILVLSAQHGTTVEELYLGDLRCAFDQANYVAEDPGCTPAVSAAYAAAINAFAGGQ